MVRSKNKNNHGKSSISDDQLIMIKQLLFIINRSI